MTNTREIRKKNIINWAINELEQIARTKSQGEIRGVSLFATRMLINDLKIFRNNTKWTDFQVAGNSLEWKKDLRLLNPIREGLLKQLRGVDDIDITKDFCDVAEAILIGFTEQWPLNDIIEQKNESTLYAPEDPISFKPLTTLVSSSTKKNKLKVALLPLDGYQISKKSLDDGVLYHRSRKTGPSGKLYLQRDFKNFNIINGELSALRNKREKEISEWQSWIGFFAMVSVIVLLLFGGHIVFSFSFILNALFDGALKLFLELIWGAVIGLVSAIPVVSILNACSLDENIIVPAAYIVGIGVSLFIISHFGLITAPAVGLVEIAEVLAYSAAALIVPFFSLVFGRNIGYKIGEAATIPEQKEVAALISAKTKNLKVNALFKTLDENPTTIIQYNALPPMLRRINSKEHLSHLHVTQGEEIGLEEKKYDSTSPKETLKQEKEKHQAQFSQCLAMIKARESWSSKVAMGQSSTVTVEVQNDEENKNISLKRVSSYGSFS